MIRVIVAAFILALASPSLAQQLDPAFLQRALDSIATQRNNALNSAAVAEVKAAMLEEQLAKAQARIKEMEEKVRPSDPATRN